MTKNTIKLCSNDTSNVITSYYIWVSDWVQRCHVPQPDVKHKKLKVISYHSVTFHSHNTQLQTKT